MEKVVNLYPNLLNSESSQNLVLMRFDKLYLRDEHGYNPSNKECKKFLMLNDFSELKSLGYWIGTHRIYHRELERILKNTGENLTSMSVKSGIRGNNYDRHIFRRNPTKAKRLKTIAYEGPISQVNLLSGSRCSNLEDLSIIFHQQVEETGNLTRRRFNRFAFFVKSAHSFTFDEDFVNRTQIISLLRDVVPILMRRGRPTCLNLRNAKIPFIPSFSDSRSYELQNLDSLESFQFIGGSAWNMSEEFIEMICKAFKANKFANLKSCSLDFFNCRVPSLLLVLLECLVKAPRLKQLILKINLTFIPKDSKPQLIQYLGSLEHLEDLQLHIKDLGQSIFVRTLASHIKQFMPAKTLKKLTLHFSNINLNLDDRENRPNATLPEFLSSFDAGNLQQLELHGKNLSGLWEKPLINTVGIFTGSLCKLKLVGTYSAKGLLDTLSKLKKHIYLEELCLRNEALSVEDMKKLKILEDLFPLLNTLDLSSNALGREGIEELSQCNFMRKISRLIIEDLNFERGLEFVSSFKQLQDSCTNLKSLSLQENRIGRMLSENFFRDLKIPSLEYLNVSSCKVNLIGLIRTMNSNTNMESLKDIRADMREFQDGKIRACDDKTLRSINYAPKPISFNLKVGVSQKSQIESPEIRALLMATLCMKRLRKMFYTNYLTAQDMNKSNNEF